MIGSLTGIVTPQRTQVLLDVNGVGYLVTTSPRLLAELAHKSNTPVTLCIYTHVREEALDLYGFETWSQRELFLLVLSVSGVGPSTAIQILNHDIHDISVAIQEANVSFFTAIPRIGKKVAQKIIIELSSKLGEVKSLQIAPQNQHFQDIRDALIGLGFAEQLVTDVLLSLQAELDFEATPMQDIMKKAIALLGNKQNR